MDVISSTIFFDVFCTSFAILFSSFLPFYGATV